VGGYPPFIKKAKAQEFMMLTAMNTLTMWVLGPMILGHSHPRVLEAVSKNNGGRFELWRRNELEVQMAELITELVPPLKWSEW